MRTHTSHLALLSASALGHLVSGWQTTFDPGSRADLGFLITLSLISDLRSVWQTTGSVTETLRVS